MPLIAVSLLGKYLMLYHIKESIVPSAFCDEVIKQSEEKDISKAKIQLSKQNRCT